MPKSLTRQPEWVLRKILGDRALVVSVDPTRIPGKLRDVSLSERWYRIRDNRFLPRRMKPAINQIVRASRPFAVSEARFEVIALEDGRTFQLMQDVWAHRRNLANSATYEEVAKRLEASGRFRYKKYEISRRDEIVPMMRTCYLELLLSMSAEGYVETKSSTFATGGLGKAILWKDGTVWHENGATHRLAAARIVNLRQGFPLRIVAVHEDWLARRVGTRARDVWSLASDIGAAVR